MSPVGVDVVVVVIVVVGRFGIEIGRSPIGDRAMGVALSSEVVESVVNGETGRVGKGGVAMRVNEVREYAGSKEWNRWVCVCDCGCVGKYSELI